jgi:hypothetical protein
LVEGQEFPAAEYELMNTSGSFRIIPARDHHCPVADTSMK